MTCVTSLQQTVSVPRARAALGWHPRDTGCLAAESLTNNWLQASRGYLRTAHWNIRSATSSRWPSARRRTAASWLEIPVCDSDHRHHRWELSRRALRMTFHRLLFPQRVHMSQPHTAFWPKTGMNLRSPIPP